MLLQQYLRNGTGILEDMAWNITAACVGVKLWFSKERKGYRFKAWSSTIGNKGSEQKSYLPWILFLSSCVPWWFWLFCGWFYGNGPKSHPNTEIFQWDPTDDGGAEITLQYSNKTISKLTLHNESWPTCTRRTELDHLHSRSQLDIYSHL